MSIEKQFSAIVRCVVREELAALHFSKDLELLTTDDVAALLKFSDRRSVYRLRREGKLRAINLGDNTLRFRATDVQRFIQECSNGENKTD